MGYLHIDNLYKAPEILECYALEKIHGTSANLSYKGSTLRFSAGGVPHQHFVGLFDAPAIESVLASKFTESDDVTVYGEAFGGSCQGMSATYGNSLRFLAFDVKLNGVWLDVPAAAGLCGELGVGFVPYERGPLRLEWLNTQRDQDSLVAVRPGKSREGVVIRAIRELNHKDGSRFIYKHKRDEFMETRTPREVDPAKAAVLTEASAVAEEWITPMRLRHVLDKAPFRSDKDTFAVIRAMREDVAREAGDEVVWSKDVEKAIGRATVKLLHSIPNQTKGQTDERLEE